MVPPINRSRSVDWLIEPLPRSGDYFQVDSVRHPGRIIHVLRFGGYGTRLNFHEHLMLAGLYVTEHRPLVFTVDNVSPPVRYVVALHREHLIRHGG